MPKKKEEVGESININKLKPIARQKTAKRITITAAEVPKQTTDTTAVAD
jgi:uridylate kinase